MVCCADLPGKLCYEKLDKKNQKMIISLCQKILIKIWSKGGGPEPPSLLPPPKKKNQIRILCQNSLTRELCTGPGERIGQTYPSA